MRYDEIIGKVMRRGRLRAHDAQRAAFATVRALGEVLDDAIADALRHNLPETLGHAVFRGSSRHPLAELFKRVAMHEDTTPGAAKEHAEVVCGVLGGVLHGDLVTRMGRDLGHPELFEWTHDDSSLPEVPPYGEGAAPLSERTLAAGKPGSEHPVAESRPELGHTHSVARSSDPHADTKLSSARGTTQERTHDTVTTAHETTQEHERRTLATTKH